jgi:transcriptional regulator with XRE-family HTH domain
MTPEVALDERMRQVAADMPEIIRALMKLRSVSGPALAERLGMSSQALYDRLRGRTAIPAPEVAGIARALRVEEAVFYRKLEDVLARLESALGYKHTALLAVMPPYEGQLELPLDGDHPDLTIISGRTSQNPLLWGGDLGTLAGGVPG